MKLLDDDDEGGKTLLQDVRCYVPLMSLFTHETHLLCLFDGKWYFIDGRHFLSPSYRLQAADKISVPQVLGDVVPKH